MIEWKEFGKDNQPPSHTEFLITNGRNVRIGRHEHNRIYGYTWWDNTDTLVENVTHYAEITLPKANGTT